MSTRKNKLRQLRDASGLSQTQLANELGTKQQIVSRWEKGKGLPKTWQMQFLEDFFHTSKEAIFFEAFNYKMKLNNNKTNKKT